MSKLVIVESPAKAKTIKKYLGGDYEVIASMGHVRDLPKARLCVDVKNDFKPKYAIIKGKEKLVSELKEAAEEADTVYLATDPDREGEAISWHLAYILGLDEDYHNRVTFNEITKTGITEGMGASAFHRPEPCERPAGTPHSRPPCGLFAQPRVPRKNDSPRSFRRPCAVCCTAHHRGPRGRDPQV